MPDEEGLPRGLLGVRLTLAQVRRRTQGSTEGPAVRGRREATALSAEHIPRKPASFQCALPMPGRGRRLGRYFGAAVSTLHISVSGVGRWRACMKWRATGCRNT